METISIDQPTWAVGIFEHVFPIRLATYLLILEEPAGEILDQRANTVQNENIKEYILNLSKN